MNIPKLTGEMRRALAATAGGPILAVDDRTGDQYILLSNADYRRLRDDNLRSQLQIAFDQVDRGEVDDLNMDELLTKAHRRHVGRNA